MKKLLLASACVLALGGLSNASAQPWAVSIDGDYNHTSFNIGHLGCPSSLCNVSGYDFDGAVDLPWTLWGIGLELNAGSHSAGGGHDTQGGGSLYWDGLPDFRFAGTFVYNSVNTLPWAPFTFHPAEWQTGAGVEWYFSPWLTASIQGGGIEGKFSGAYFGGTLKGYIFPDLSLAGYYNYYHLSAFGLHGNESDFGVKGEWLFWQDTLPLSLTAGYEHSQINENFGLSHIHPDTFHIGLKLYLDEGMAPKPLVERNRTGTLDTIGPLAPIGFRTHI